ncbi:GntR family transcriptional regulator [Streptomyces sp. NPDC090306]|uniref:GntR family transcriptional regulator n=1 Tax=Streptomyces sp. NPDC090306 TaxID=3365961 RepID=UPI0038091BA8
MTQGAQGSSGTGTPGRPAGGEDPRVPAQGRARGADRPYGVPAPAARDEHPGGPGPDGGHTRGEHVHDGHADGAEYADADGHAGDGHAGAGPAGHRRAADGPTAAARPPSALPARAVVRRSSVRGQVLDALRAALLAGDLVPGEVYSGPALGDRFGVSATPVREAMQQLALEGAVEVVPNRGFRVTVRGPRELAELAEVRALLEVPVVLRLVRGVPSEGWARLRPLAEATVRAASTGCRAAYAESDRAFHRAVLALAGNEQLVRVAEDLHRRAQWPPAGEAAGGARTDLIADAAEHTALLDALVAHDTDAVRSLLREHYAAAR